MVKICALWRDFRLSDSLKSRHKAKACIGYRVTQKAFTRKTSYIVRRERKPTQRQNFNQN